jgi:CRP-like cAMP-binding protein
MTGLRVETVIRTMKHMEEKGLLTIEHRKVIF